MMTQIKTIIFKSKIRESLSRISFLKKLFKETVSPDKCRIIDIGLSDFIVISSQDLLENSTDAMKRVLGNVLALSENKDNQYVIFDVSGDKDLFSAKEPLPSYLTLCCICANYITCSSKDLQEVIYTNTGRLAYILTKDKDIDDLETVNDFSKVLDLTLKETFVPDLSYLS